MVLGFGLGMLRDLSDRVFRTSKQVENLLEADCVALVPLIESGEAKNEFEEIKTKSEYEPYDDRRNQ